MEHKENVSVVPAHVPPLFPTPLEGFQKGDEVVLVLLRKIEAESSIVESDGVCKRRGGAVVEVGRTARESAQNRVL